MFLNLGDTRKDFEEGYSNWAFQKFEQALEDAVCFYVNKAGKKTREDLIVIALIEHARKVKGKPISAKEYFAKRRKQGDI